MLHVNTEKNPQIYGKPKQYSVQAFPKSISNMDPSSKNISAKVPIVEMYTATEGVFGQQLDDLPYITPNYDSYLFEVATGRGVKMLHELKRGEWGSLIVSSCMFPRYEIGDLIESAGKNYYRVFGRKKTSTLLEHRLYRAFLGRII